MKTNAFEIHRIGIVAVRALVAVALTLALAQNACAELTHRYSFDTDNEVLDSVGDAHGTLMNGAYVTGGFAGLFGSAASGPDCDYIELPPGMITGYTSATFELWVDVDQNGNWCEIFAFGNQNANGQGANMVMFCPHSGSAPADHRMSYAQADPGFNDEYVVNGVGTLDLRGPTYIACVYDPPNNTMALYANGTLVGSVSPPVSAGFSLDKVNNTYSWLGRSLYNGDAQYLGIIDEFRVHDAALGPLQIAINHFVGPDTVVSDIAVEWTDWSADPEMPIGSRQSGALTFDADPYGSFTVTEFTDATYSSSDPAVVSVNTRGQLFAMAIGTATITASYGGETKDVVVEVTSPELVHRYSFTADANDSIGSAHGTLVNATINNGAVELTTGDLNSADADTSYVDLPNDLLSSLTAVSLEIWVTDNGSRNWARIWDFGNSGGGEDVSNGGSRYMFLSLPAGGGDLYGSIRVHDRVGGENGLGWANLGRPPVGQKTHIVWVMDVANQRGWLYGDGALVGNNTSMNLAPADIGPMVNVWLGRSQYNDPMFNGSIDEFRIWNGPLTALQVALNAVAGPDNPQTIDPGALQSLELSLATPDVVFGGNSVQAALVGDFENATDINLTSVEGTTFESSNPSIATISALGVVEATSLGTVTLTGSYAGQNATLEVTTTTPPGYTTPTLVHRYSFSEAPGTTAVNDSVGTAHGTILGQGADFDGQGQLILPGGTASNADPIAGYVDLPNGIISVLSDLSIEAWVTYEGSGSWQRVFDFGTSNGGEDVSDGNGNYLFLSPAGGADLRFSVRDPATNTEPAPLTAADPLVTGQEVYLAVVYNYTANLARLYLNAEVVASGPAPVDITTINDVNNWLGRSQWPDAMFQGKYNEFRIWNGTLLPDRVAQNYAAGPDSTEARPTLAVSVAAGNVVIAWPASTNFQLESTTALGPASSWSTVDTSGAVVEGDQKKLTVAPSAEATFYRMKQ